MTQYLKLYGETLVELGYTVLPIRPGTKRPDIKDWPRHATTAADVRAWYSNGRSQHGVGINARNTPAIDVDVLDVRVADEMSRAIDEIFPGVPLMTRTGLAPKFLIPFRSDEPFKKLTSTVYTDGTHEHKVEILGDGQQWVAYHVHPDSGQPYAWFDGVGDDGIRGVSTRDLPHLTRELAQRVIDAFEALAAEQLVAGRWHAVSSAPAERADRLADDPFAPEAPPTDLSRSEIEWLLSKRDAHGYAYWIKVGMMLHHHFSGEEEGFEIWNAWSSKADNYDAENMRGHWDSFGHRTDAPATFRQLIAEHGQPPKAELSAPYEKGAIIPAPKFAGAGTMEWHIKHVLPKRALTVVYGAPGSSKSFFVLDMVAHVCRGLQWRQHRTKHSRALYVVAEGAEGFRTRLAAYQQHHGVTLDDLYVRPGGFLLADHALELAQQVKDLGDIGVIVIDTLAAVTPGANENTSEDMGRAIAAANLMTQTCGAAVILIHHANKQGELRGWSGLLAAADNTIRIEYDREKNLRTAHIEKMKEAKSGEPYGYRLEVVDLGTDEDGDAITSCVVVETEETAPNTSGQGGSRKERKSRSGDFETSRNYDKARHYLRIIEEIAGLSGANLDEAEVITAIQKDKIVNPMEEENHPTKKNIIPTLRTLAQLGKIEKEGRWIRLC